MSTAYADFQKLAGGLEFPQVRLAVDGPPYLHVFARLRILNEAAPTIEFMSAEEVLQAQACQRAIQNLLHDSIHEPKHYEKLRWLANYWNSTVVSETSGQVLEAIVFPISRLRLG